MNTYLVNGVELAAVDRGTGLPLLLVHGFPLNHSLWQAQIDACAERCRVIAPDLRGFGTSGVSEGEVSMEQMADDLAGLLDTMGIQEPVVYCGLSMGGYIAWEFWRRHRPRVAGLILCDTRAAADSPEAAANRRLMADRVLGEGPAPIADAMIPRLTAEVTLTRYPERVEAVRRMIFSNDPRGIAAASRGMANRADATPLLPEIACPTLLIVGQHDQIVPVAEMRAMAEAIPHARLVEIRGAGHLSPLENPAEVNAAMLSFLGELKA
jgi:pimeloyl-ACP methyl ester carboxylesterase